MTTLKSIFVILTIRGALSQEPGKFVDQRTISFPTCWTLDPLSSNCHTFFAGWKRTSSKSADQKETDARTDTASSIPITKIYFTAIFFMTVCQDKLF